MNRLSPDFADATLAGLEAQFHRLERPVDISFRTILGQRGRDRTPHDLHPYPARLLPSIPSFFLATTLSRPRGVVLDPFCGSGTVLVEAVLAGRDVIGADANPLARLITQTKITPLDATTLSRALLHIRKRIPEIPRRAYPDVVNLEYWFYPHVRRDLLRLLEGISTIPDSRLRAFFWVALSACIKEVSLADPRLSVPVRLRQDQYARNHWLYEKTRKRLQSLRNIDVVGEFTRRVHDNMRRLSRLSDHADLGSSLGILSDARNLHDVTDGIVDLIITSPPYLGAQKYIRASSLSLTWLGFCASRDLRALEDQNIGREHFSKACLEKQVLTGIPMADQLLERVRKRNALRAHIAATYLVEMRDALREMRRVLRSHGYLVLVAGDSSVCGMRFPTPAYLASLATDLGFHLKLHLVDHIRSRALMTKRHRTAGRIDSESVLILQA